MNTGLKIISFANCCMFNAPWITNLYPHAKVNVFVHTEGLLRLIKGHTIICEDINPPFKNDMPILNPIDVSKIDAFIWSPLVDECVGISMLKDTERSPYPIESEESHRTHPPGPLYHEETLKILWKELNEITKNIPHRFIITYPATYLNYDFESLKKGLPNMFKTRVENLNKISSSLFTSLGWTHYELDAEFDEDKYWCHFSINSRQNLYKKIEKDLGII